MNLVAIQNCPFCENNPVGEKVINNQEVFETDLWRVLLEHKPMKKQHFIIVPKEHRETRFDLTEEEFRDLFVVNQNIRKIFQGLHGKDRNMQYEKNGVGISHFQIHVMPINGLADLIWLQVKLFFRSFPIPVFTLSQKSINRQIEMCNAYINQDE